jgi:hypothetical protein
MTIYTVETNENRLLKTQLNLFEPF